MQILMLSASREGDSDYLQHAVPMITEHLGDITKVLFIPYAGVTISWDDYTARVQHALPQLQVEGVHQYSNPQQAIKEAQAILVGGGNTFNLLNELYQNDLISLIQQQVKQGTPYIGWSAGSNICGNSIRTTNDMPIIEPPSFNALNLVPFQLNPHYTDYQPPGHNGETRAQRIEEFMVLNPDMPVIGIREGSALQRQGDQLTLLGNKEAIVFSAGQQQIIQAGEDLSRYLSGQ